MKKLIATTLVFSACHNHFDQPPLKALDDGAAITVTQLRNKLHGDNSLYHFTEGDSSIYLTVTMDEAQGNLYKQVYAADKDGRGILLKLLTSGGLYTGDAIRINLNNTWLVCANNMVTLDSLDLAKHVVKLSSGHLLQPIVKTVEEIMAKVNYADAGNLQSSLVMLSDVEFDASSQGLTLANAIGKSSLEHPLGKCGGKKIYLRTSGLASFAGKVVPSGHGSISGIIQQYNSEFTLVLRNYSEIQMQGSNCGPPDTTKTGYLLYKDFDDKNLSSGGWINAAVTGTTSWAVSNIGQSSYYARIYNKTNSVYEACEAWLISPEVNLSAASAPALSFLTANSSTASPLSLMISENYQSGMPATATWTELNFTIQKNSFTYCPSGEIDLSAYKNKKIRLAFKYSGTNSTGSIWDVDKIQIKEIKN